MGASGLVRHRPESSAGYRRACPHWRDGPRRNAYEEDDHHKFVGTYAGLDRGFSAAFERILSRRLTVTALYEFRHEDHLRVFDDQRQGVVLLSYVAPSGL